ncbi:hypothetical protein GQ54DRAFT_299260 [Martensiomyces pterosporus]|nr:hypothetical protein GQ54DRAFT_299260 [Martensiomyces pterosporus]
MSGNAGTTTAAGGRPASYRRTYANAQQAGTTQSYPPPPASYTFGLKRPTNKSAPATYFSAQQYVYPEVKTTYLSPPPIEPLLPVAALVQPAADLYSQPPTSYNVGTQYQNHYTGYQQPQPQFQQQQYHHTHMSQYAQSAPPPLSLPPQHQPAPASYATAEPAPLYQPYSEAYTAGTPSSPPPPPMVPPPVMPHSSTPSAPAQQPPSQPPPAWPLRPKPSLAMSPHQPAPVVSTSQVSQQQQQQQQPAWSSMSGNGAQEVQCQLQVAYHRNWERQRERSPFSTLFHCLEPVSLVSRAGLGAHAVRKRGNLHPMYKANEEWISPSVGMPLENKPGYRCIMYIVDGTLLFDNGLSGEKILSKGTLHMSTTGHDISTYVRNPSKTHHVHLIRLWIDTEGSPTAAEGSSDRNGNVRNNGDRKRQKILTTPASGKYPDFSYAIRYVSDSDKRNCLLLVAQPRNYRPSFGMTSLIFGSPDGQSRNSGAVSSLGSSYYLSQSMVFTRPEFFSPVPLNNGSMDTAIGNMSNEWSFSEQRLTSRACADPLLVDEDLFLSVCCLDSLATVVYEPLDSHDKHRNATQQGKAKGGRRRVWIQALLGDVGADVANGGRLVINGDKVNRMRQGDSAYVRKLAPQEALTIYNCGRSPIEFIIAETPY